MPAKALILLFLSVGAAALAVIGVRDWMQNQRDAVQASLAENRAPRGMVEILVAKRDVPAGTLVQDQLVEWRAWPEDAVMDAHIRRDDGDAASMFGAVVRSGFAKTEPLARNRLVFPGERGFLAAVLNPGMRAVAVPVNATTGIAGFVFPGDRVDVILTHELLPPGGGREMQASETVLSDIRVLAVDQSTNDQSTEPNPAKTVTVELTPKQAEKISVIQNLGRLSLSLRSLKRETVDGQLVGDASYAEDSAEPMPERTASYTWDNEVSRLLNARPHRLVVARGDAVAVMNFGGMAP